MKEKNELRNFDEEAVKVTGLRSLEEEKERLERLCRRMEYEKEERLEHLRKHWFAMTLNSVLPKAHPEKQLFNLAGAGIKSAWESANFRSIALNGAVTFIEFIGVRMGVNFIEKYLKKRKEKKD